MEDRAASRLRNVVTNIVNHRETNLALTVIFGIVMLYIALVAMLKRSVLHPLTLDETPLKYDDGMMQSTTAQVLPVNGSGVYWRATSAENSSEFFVSTIFSLLLLWICSLILGRIANYFFLPSLLGMLLTGVLFANVGLLNEILSIHSSWANAIIYLSFILCIVRAGTNVDVETLKRSWFICSNLGIFSAVCEVAAVTLVAHFLYSTSISVAILFGVILAANSPAVTAPSLFRLMASGRGIDKGVPTAMLSASVIDNICCIIAYNAVSSALFKYTDNANWQTLNGIAYTIFLQIAKLLMGCLFGILAGLALRVFPRYDLHMAHFMRAILLYVTACAFIFTAFSIQSDIAGPVSVLLMSAVATSRWKVDNHRMTGPEENAFIVVWECLFMPLLFAHFGLLLDFSIFTWMLVWQALATLGIAMLTRIIATFVVSTCTNLNVKEKCFVSICFMPKATMQAVIVPFMLGFAGVQSDVVYITLTCALGIFISALFAPFLFELFGALFLNKHQISAHDNLSNAISKISSPFTPPTTYGGATTTASAISLYESTKEGIIRENHSPLSSTDQESLKDVHLSDKDNRLRLQVNPVKPLRSLNGYRNDEQASGNATPTSLLGVPPPPPPPTVPPPPLATFEEINQRAFELFKNQRLTKIREDVESEGGGATQKSAMRLDKSPPSVAATNFSRHPQPAERRLGKQQQQQPMNPITTQQTTTMSTNPFEKF